MKAGLYHTQGEGETAVLAAALAAGVRPGAVVCLHGDLGMGKSVFARALIRALANDAALDVPSPTYTLVQDYETPLGVLHHFDLYRLSAPEDVYELGWEEAVPGGIALVEWPERLGHLLPAPRTDIHLKPGPDGPDSRVIEVRNAG